MKYRPFLVPENVARDIECAFRLTARDIEHLGLAIPVMLD
jgi:hypothetical protein